jgi:hypothetical protein
MRAQAQRKSGENLPITSAEGGRCDHSENRPVRELCGPCTKKRRRILDRIRKRGGGGTARPAHITITEVARLNDHNTTVAAAQVAVEDRARLTGQPLPREVETLLIALAGLRTALTKALAPSTEELTEINRPGGRIRHQTASEGWT